MMKVGGDRSLKISGIAGMSVFPRFGISRQLLGLDGAAMFVFTVLCLFGGGEFGGKLVGPRAAAAALSDYCRGVVANVSTSCHIGAGGHFRPFNSETSCCISLLTANLERCFCDPELVQSMSQVFGIAPSVAIMALDGCAIPPSSVNIYNISGCLDARGVRITESSPTVNVASPETVELTKLGPRRPNILIQPVQDPLLTLPALEPVEIHVTPTSSPPSDVAINTTNVAGVAAENLLPSANDSWWLSTPAVSAQSPPQSLDQMHPYDMYHAPIPNNMLYTPIEMDSRAEDTELQTDFALLDFTTDVAMTLGTEGSSAMVPGSPFSSAIAPSPVAKEEEEIDAHIKDRLQATFYERGDDLDWMFSSSSLTSSSSNSFSSSTSSSSSSSSSRDGDRADHGRGHSTAGSKRYPKDLGTTEESRHHSRDEVPSSKLF